jgi:transcriptional regulator with XRE-family HTH domain
MLKICAARPAFRRTTVVARVAVKCGVSPVTVYRWMRGQTSPTPEQLKRLAWAMQRSRAELVGEV